MSTKQSCPRRDKRLRGIRADFWAAGARMASQVAGMGSVPVLLLLVLAACGTGTGTLGGRIGNQLPVFTNVPPAAAQEGALYQFQALATDADGDALSFDLTEAPAGMTATAAGLVTWTPLAGQAGTHRAALRVSDGIAMAELRWIVAVAAVGSDAPRITSAAPTTATVGQVYNYQIVAVGTPAPAISVGGVVPTWLSFDAASGILSGMPGLGDAGSTGVIVVTISNGVLPDDTQSFSILVSAAGTGVAPAIASAAPTTALAGMMYSYVIVATGTPTPGVAVSGAPAWMSFDAATNTLAGVPPAPAGGPGASGTTGLITVTADNGIGLPASEEFTITVSQGWSSEILAQGYNGFSAGEYSSIAVDASGAVHIAYYVAKILKYMTNASGSWAKETVDDVGVAYGVGWYAELALDSNGKAHIAYYLNGSNHRFKYARNTSGSWEIDVIETLSTPITDNGSDIDIAIDTSGIAHVAYAVSHAAGHSITYAHRTSGSWQTETIAAWTGPTGNQKRVSLAIDGANAAHVAFNGPVSSGSPSSAAGYEPTGINYATKLAGGWVVESMLLPRSDNAGDSASIALDPNGNVHISCFDIQNFNLVYVTNAGGAWTFETIDALDHVGRFTSLAIDTSGTVHIAYYDQTNTSLKYASNGAGAWVTETADNMSLQSGIRPSLALDANGKAHVSHFDGISYLIYTKQD